MKENPIVQLLKELKPTPSKSGLLFGNIANLSPLSVTIGDIELTHDNLKINADLTLLVGDEVALFPSGDYAYYVILCKVVNA